MEWTRLPDLLRAILRVPGEFRVRLSSIEATEVTRELIAVMAEHPHRICPHLHICLQSGSDAVLRRMRRRWGAKRFLDRCSLVKEKLHKPALTTDIIIGFPGETDADFEASCNVAQQVGFSKIHVFPFSARRDTPAAEMPDQISKHEKSDRVARLSEIEARLRKEYFESLIGEDLQMLVEGSCDGIHRGTTGRYAPISIDQHGLPDGELVRVRAQTLSAGALQALRV